MSRDVRLIDKAPETCPKCSFDPTGDDEEFTSGGGWAHDNWIVDDVWTDQLVCPVCGKTVAEKQQRLGGRR